MVVKDLKALSKALKKDSQEIRIEDPALTELRILAASDIKGFKKALKNGGLGAAISGAGVVAAIFTGGILLPFVLLGAGIATMGKSLTADLALGIKDDHELKVAKNDIAKKYKGLNMKEVYDLMNRYYTETSKGNTYSVLTHK